ncbi:RraA family protein [Streptomyces collinus]|uniref:RraA family protein n=1 Tax=Streptomyces collinus TaxID=42684 RepID=UPI0037F2BD38
MGFGEGVRDTESLWALGLLVFSRSVSVKETVGPMCEPVTAGGRLVRPGDAIRWDADGVVVVRREDAGTAAVASQERVEAEEGGISAYRAGRTVIGMCDLTPLLAAKDLVVDEE